MTQQELAAGARGLGLDFLVSTEHNQTDTYDLWAPHVGSDLLVMLGEEVVTGTGHWLALGLSPEQLIDWGYDAHDVGAIDSRLRQVRAAGGLCVAAHPHAPYDSGTLDYSLTDFDLIEVWNGLWSSDRPWNADNKATLADWASDLADALTDGALTDGAFDGRWRPAVGNSDVHLAGQLGTPITVVLAEELSTPAILAGLRAGRSWIAESTAIDLSFTASSGERGAGIGERLEIAGESVEVVVTVRCGVSGGIVSIHNEVGEVYRQVLPDVGSDVVRWSTSAGESRFVRVEMRHPNGDMAALANPIFLS